MPTSDPTYVSTDLEDCRVESGL